MFKGLKCWIHTHDYKKAVIFEERYLFMDSKGNTYNGNVRFIKCEHCGKWGSIEGVSSLIKPCSHSLIKCFFPPRKSIKDYITSIERTGSDRRCLINAR